ASAQTRVQPNRPVSGLRAALGSRYTGTSYASDSDRAAMPVSGCGRASRLGGGSLLVEPHVGQVLIDVVARADLPALHIRSRGDDAIPPPRHPHVYLGVENVFFELADHRSLLGRIGLVEERLIERNLLLVVVVAVVLGVDRVRQELADVHERVHHALTVEVHGDVEGAVT